MQSFKLGMERGTICQKEGVLFLSKMVYKKGKWPDLGGGGGDSRYKTLLSAHTTAPPPHPHLPGFCPIKINFALVPKITFYWAENGKKAGGSSRPQNSPHLEEVFTHTEIF